MTLHAEQELAEQLGLAEWEWERLTDELAWLTI